MTMNRRPEFPVRFLLVLAATLALVLAGTGFESTPEPSPAAVAETAGDPLAGLSSQLPPTAIAAPYAPESPQPLGTPAPLTTTSTAYAFLRTNPDGSPVAYDPCRPVHYVTSEANAPAEGGQLIQEAIAAVSRATGLVFVHDGTTTETPAARHSAFQPERYGYRPAPVVIGWRTPAEEPRFDMANPGHGIILGYSDSEAFPTSDGRHSYVSGRTALNGPGFQLLIEKAGIDAARGVIEHELGHLVGLDHVSDPTQLMNPDVAPGITEYQPGDLTGLAKLGRGKCQPGL